MYCRACIKNYHTDFLAVSTHPLQDPSKGQDVGNTPIPVTNDDTCTSNTLSNTDTEELSCGKNEATTASHK